MRTRLLRFVLNDHGSGNGLTCMNDIVDSQPHQVASPEFAVDGQVEQGEITNPIGDLQTNSNGPDFLEFKWRFRADEFAFVLRPPRRMTLRSMGDRLHLMFLCLLGEPLR